MNLALRLFTGNASKFPGFAGCLSSLQVVFELSHVNFSSCDCCVFLGDLLKLLQSCTFDTINIFSGCYKITTSFLFRFSHVGCYGLVVLAEYLIIRLGFWFLEVAACCALLLSFACMVIYCMVKFGAFSFEAVNLYYTPRNNFVIACISCT